MEKNEEIAEGNYTSHHRLYDARLGRWWSVDPEFSNFKLTSYSTYHSTFNNPIVFVDRDGDHPIIGIIWGITKVAALGGIIGGSVAGAFGYASGKDVTQEAAKGFVEGVIVGTGLAIGAGIAASAQISGYLYYAGMSGISFYSGFAASIAGQMMERNLFGTRGHILSGEEAISDGAVTAILSPASEFFISFSSEVIKKSTKVAIVNPNDKVVKQAILEQFKKEIQALPKSQRPTGKTRRQMRHAYMAGAKEVIREENATSNTTAKIWEVKTTTTVTNTGSVVFDAVSKKADDQYGEEVSLHRKEVEVKGSKAKVTQSSTYTAYPQ